MVIFDFDQTMVDTSSLALLRTARKWSEVNRRARSLSPYPGITELLGELRAWDQSIAIVTTSPSMVAEGFAQRCHWPIDTVIGYHQVSLRKPDPEGLMVALEHCNAEASTSFHVGDRTEDTVASRRAGVVAIGAGWGSEDVGQLRESRPDHLFMTVAELRTYFKDVVGSKNVPRE